MFACFWSSDIARSHWSVCTGSSSVDEVSWWGFLSAMDVERALGYGHTHGQGVNISTPTETLAALHGGSQSYNPRLPSVQVVRLSPLQRCPVRGATQCISRTFFLDWPLHTVQLPRHLSKLSLMLTIFLLVAEWCFMAVLCPLRFTVHWWRTSRLCLVWGVINKTAINVHPYTSFIASLSLHSGICAHKWHYWFRWQLRE